MSKASSNARTARFFHRLRASTGLYLLLLPSFILVLIFAYRPMYGVVIAFKDFKPALGIAQSPWAQPLIKHFLKFFNTYQFSLTLKNTLALSFYSLLAGFPFPIAVALAINQMRAKKFQLFYQTVSYLPHFISTVVMVGLIILWLSPGNGLIGQLYGIFNAKAPNLMGMKSAFSSVYVWSDIWQHTGWNSIIYFAALSSIDPTLYEAATVDGASRWQKIRYIDLPLLMSTAMILLILSAGNIMNVAFEKVFLMQNQANLSASEVISTYVYKTGITQTQYSYSAAVNFFNTLCNLSLLIAVNQVSKRLSNNSLW
ncbi:MAG: ABC transporter permease subunit [Clostridiales bacterium]|jgi:putative aldouronate transport system permease protein|nr:ABC transporter permease subunit [Clostridiales bacterium]